MVTLSMLTAQADIVRTLEKSDSLTAIPYTCKHLANPPFNTASVCTPVKERLYPYLYKLHSHIGTKVG
jgi:hypothetical protein